MLFCEIRLNAMAKHKKSDRRNPLDYIVLAAALVKLVEALISLINKLID